MTHDKTSTITLEHEQQWSQNQCYQPYLSQHMYSAIHWILQ